MSDLRKQVVQAAEETRTGGWKFGMLLAEVADSDAHMAWGFSSVRAWILSDLRDWQHNYKHFLRVGRFVRGLPEAERPRWLAQDVWSVIAAGKWLQDKPHELIDRLESGATYSQVRQAAAQAQPDQHEESEWRTVSFKVSVPVYWLWTRALNRARYEACERDPTIERLIECLCAALTNEPLYQPDNGIPAPEWYNAVHDGEIRCYECKSWDRSQLDFHHTVPRGRGGAESVQVPLCRECHTRIQPRWREWLAKHPELQAIHTFPCDQQQGQG